MSDVKRMTVNGPELELSEDDHGEFVYYDDYEREVRCAIAAGIRMQDKCTALEAELATVQGVNQQLLEALVNAVTWIEQPPVPTVGVAGQLVKIAERIAAARKGE